MGTNTGSDTGSGMNLAAGIGAIIGLALLFFFCGLICYAICCMVFKGEAKDSTKPERESFTAKHYYDPLPTVLSPPASIFQPTLYSFKLRNSSINSHHMPHVVINPAVLQYPPGHVLENKTTRSQPSRGYSSSKVSPTNVPLVQSDMNEIVHGMENGDVKNSHKGWQPLNPMQLITY